MRAIIVDDEKPARDLVREHLSQRTDVQIVDECANGFEALRSVTRFKPDVLFLDIQMPKLDGFEVIDLLDSNPLVVFVTAYDDYAVRAFEVHAVDYVLKPVNRERLDAVVDRLHERLRSHHRPSVEGMGGKLRQPPLRRIPVREGDSVEVLPVARLEYVEAQDDYVMLVGGGKKLRKLQRLSELEELLPAEQFVRIHRSYIANIEKIEKVEAYAKDSRVAVMRDGTRIPVSRSGYGRLKEKIEI
ncbi:MAG: response regulator [Acidobacteria bacterium]|nr:response regulator [Acidobacteriota bacterium]